VVSQVLVYSRPRLTPMLKLTLMLFGLRSRSVGCYGALNTETRAENALQKWPFVCIAAVEMETTALADLAQCLCVSYKNHSIANNAQSDLVSFDKQSHNAKYNTLRNLTASVLWVISLHPNHTQCQRNCIYERKKKQLSYQVHRSLRESQQCRAVQSLQALQADLGIQDLLVDQGVQTVQSIRRVRESQQDKRVQLLRESL